MEHKRQALAKNTIFATRILKQAFIALIVLLFSWAIGSWGYHFFAKLPWIDAIYQASMILSGMGPVQDLQTNAAKIFASIYAIFSGLILIGIFSLIFAPILHRILHQLHLEE